MTLWVVVANSSSAEIFSINGREIKKIEHLDFPQGRQKGDKIFSDKAGRSFDRHGASRHALGTEVDLHMQGQQTFARQVAASLEKGKNGNLFSKLALIAPPQFLGELRNMLSDQVKKIIYKEINKDIPAAQTEYERIESIYSFLDLPVKPSVSG